MPLFGTLQWLMTCFLYFHLNAFWKMPFEIIEQKVWGFEHFSIDGLFIYLFLNGLIDDLGLVYIYIYIYIISPLVCITLIQTTGLIVIWKEVPNFCGIQHLGYRILLGLFSTNNIIWCSQHNIYKRKC